MHKKKLLIFGGTGFLGFHTAKQALKNGWDVSSISKKKPKKERYLKGLKYYFCNISNKNKLDKILKSKYDFIINYSGYVDHSNKKLTYLSHYIGCKNIVDTLIRKKILPKLFIQIGSSIENGKAKSPQIEIPINKAKKFSSVYGQSKFNSSKYLIEKFKKFNFPSIVLRPYLIYGPKQDANRFIPYVVQNCIKNKIFSVSSCAQYRDFLYIEDFINLLFKILKSKKGKGEIFNVGSGRPTQLKKILNLVLKKIKKGKPVYGVLKLRKDEISKMYPSIKKIKKYYKWFPETDLDVGINKTIKSFKID